MRNLIDDFPHEFKGKPKIEALCRILDLEFQMIEVAAAQVSLILCIDTSEGKQLDMIGEIVVLSRSDAAVLAQKNGVKDFTQDNDEYYRRYLKYKILANTSHCTYQDIITAIKMIWNVDKVDYYENEDGPASLTVHFPYQYSDDNIFIIPPLTAAGVGINVKAETKINSACGLNAMVFGQALLKGTIAEPQVCGGDFITGIKAVPFASMGIRYDVTERIDTKR